MRINWENELSNANARAIYQQFVEGKISRRRVEMLFRFTPFAGAFRALVENGGAKHARDVARKALGRRNAL